MKIGFLANEYSLHTELRCYIDDFKNILACTMIITVQNEVES